MSSAGVSSSAKRAGDALAVFQVGVVGLRQHLPERPRDGLPVARVGDAAVEHRGRVEAQPLPQPARRRREPEAPEARVAPPREHLRDPALRGVEFLGERERVPADPAVEEARPAARGGGEAGGPLGVGLGLVALQERVEGELVERFVHGARSVPAPPPRAQP